MKGTWKRWLRIVWPAWIGLAGTIVIWFLIPVPYIVYEPGKAASTTDMVTTQGGQEREEGVFLLTTVRWTYANVFKYAISELDPDAEILEKTAVTQGASRSDYLLRQSLNMRSSHANAMEAVYRVLNIPYAVRSGEIVVLGIVQGLGADGVLRPGDRLIAVDGVTIAGEEDVRKAMEGKRSGDTISLTYRRGEREERTELTLMPLPNTNPPRAGMGLTYGTLQTVESIDPAYRVTIQPGAITGPSAGLLFALEIYDRFTEGNLTKGYVIAGTGEIAPDGKVGAIGGVVHKVAGAHREGADVFLVPRENSEAAKRKAAELGTPMKIVPVGTLEDALRYLESLPERSTRTGGLK